MLKSTHRSAPAATAPAPLPSGWTEHKAPSGHIYYYNAETKKSTYTRPVAEPDELQIDFEATAPDQVLQASMRIMEEFREQNSSSRRGQGQFSGGRSYQDRTRRDKFHDRPKAKKPIKGCEPWILVTTKFKRRFVHNTDTKESLWKFPSEVMMAVIEMEKQDWQDKQGDNLKASARKQELEAISTSNIQNGQSQPQEFDSDSYEEVEVTDDEDQDAAMKRQRVEQQANDMPSGPVEFDEDDIAWQLAQIEEDEYGDEDFEHKQYGDDEGSTVDHDESKTLFESLLDSKRVNPYSPFEDLVDGNNSSIVDDDRWTALPTMASRRSAFKEWSKNRIAEIKEQELRSTVVERKQDPRVNYLEFLREHATTKLYWPEFKRKFKKEAIMKDYEISDKDREKLYREYTAKLKTSDADRKKDFIHLLKAIPEDASWHRQTTLSTLPDQLIRDIRYYGIRDKRDRDNLVEAHIGSLKG